MICKFQTKKLTQTNLMTDFFEINEKQKNYLAGIKLIEIEFTQWRTFFLVRCSPIKT